MSSKDDHYRVRAEECCLKAVRAEDNSRCMHWLEAAARWVALGRQEAAVLTTSDSTTVDVNHACPGLIIDVSDSPTTRATHSGIIGEDINGSALEFRSGRFDTR